MKKNILCAAILLAVVALASCYWRPNSSTGGLSVDISGIAPKAVGDVVRIYLIADGLLFSTGGGVPFAAEISAEDSPEKTISIDGLPVGPVYKAMVGYGPVSSGIFYPQYYGESEQFMVTPNADTAVTVWIESVPYSGNVSYSSDLLGRKLVGIVESDYSDLYAAEASRLHHFAYSYPDSWNPPASYDLPYRVNSLSRGSPLFGVGTYLNTANGVFPFYESDGWVVDASFSESLGGSRNIRGSGSFIMQPAGVNYAVFFWRDNGLGGSYVLSTDISFPNLWGWANIDVAGVSGMAVSEYNAYFAADGAAFALPPIFLQDTSPTLAEHRIDPPEFAPLPSVRSLGFRPIIAAAGGTLFLGTADGVWQAGVNESAISPFVSVSLGPTQVGGTEGDSIEMIAINNNSGYHEAYLSRYYLYIVKSSSLNKIPFFAVVPGRATGMAWDSSWTLYIAGTEGLSAIYIGS